MLLTVFVALALSDDVTSARETAYARVPLAQKIAVDPVLQRAIVARNRTAETADEIHRRDEEWIKNPGYPLRKQLTQNECAARLKALVRDDAFVVEAFLMDERGGIVCSTVETQDYWQGDEAKWKKTYGEGKAVFLDEPALDTNTETFAVQLSVVVSQASQKIGALTLTLKVPRSAIKR
jgi:hypothetical protein